MNGGDERFFYSVCPLFFAGFSSPQAWPNIAGKP